MSRTPLAKKLGVKEGSRLLLVDAPPAFEGELGSLPPGAEIARDPTGPLELVLLFVRGEAELRQRFDEYAARLAPTGMLWIGWPKKASKVSTNLTFAVVQRIGLAAGLVDTKVCAINEIWSGLRFVTRVKDRPAP